MALSFGRKKAEAANEAGNSIKSEDNSTQNVAQQPPTGSTRSGVSATDEPIDDSWFENFSEDAPASSATSVAPAAPDFSAPEPDFSVFDTQDNTAEDSGGFGESINAPTAQAAASSPMSDGGAFVDPATSGTPFDMPAVPAASGAKSKKGGGLKKLLPVLLVLLIVGGGGAFWYSQQSSSEIEDEGMVSGGVPGGAPGVPATGSPAGSAPTGAPQASGAPTGASPTGAATGAAAPATASDPKTKAQLKKLWDEGLAFRKQNKIPAAKAKWGAAVRIARSKPGFAKSGDMIQQALDKLK